MNDAMLTDATRIALAQLRDPRTFDWTIVCILAVTVFLFQSEAREKRYNVVAAGFAMWLADGINELLNSAVLHWTGRAPLWAETGHTAYQILVGLNAESTFMFLIYGMAFAKSLPEDPHARILGINNRLAFSIGAAILSVMVEVVLNALGVLNWYWPFWNKPYGLPTIVIFGYVWFFLAAAWAYDAPNERVRWLRVGSLAAIAAGLALTFGFMGWL